MPAPTVAASDVQTSSYSYNGTFAPQTSADRALCVLVASADVNQDERSTVSVLFDNTVLTNDMGHIVSNDGSPPWDAANADAFVANDTFLDAAAASANLSAQNTGEGTVVFLVDLADVVDGTPDDSSTVAGNGTASTVTANTTLAGDIDITHTWSGSQNYAHIVVAFSGTDSANVIVLDCLCVWGATTSITIDSGHTLLHAQTHTRGSSEMSTVCSYRVVTGTGGQTVALGLVNETDQALPATPIGGGSAPSSVGAVGHWTDSAGLQLPTTAYTAIAFATETRNDGIYTQISSTVFELDEAGDYRITCRVLLQSTNNNRCNIQARIVQVAGTSTATFTTNATAYVRNYAEDHGGIEAEAYIVGASADSRFSVEWRRDADPMTNGTLANQSSVQVVRWSHDAVAIYGLTTTNQALGGVSPNTVGLSAVHESDTSKIAISANTIELKTTGKWYAVIAGIAGDGGTSRTQRVARLKYTDGPTGDPRAVCYQREGDNEYGGLVLLDLVHHSGGANPKINLQCWRGDGITADAGGASIDGAWFSDTGGVCVIELPSGVECARYYDSVGLQSITSLTPVPLNLSRDTSVEDSTSFSRFSASAVDCVQTSDIMVFASVYAARSDVISAVRMTSEVKIQINGVPQQVGAAIDYSRGNQGTTDTYGWSACAGGIYEVASSDRISATAARAGTGVGGGDRTQPDTSVFLAINLDSWPAPSTPQTVNVGLSEEISSALVLSPLVSEQTVALASGPELNAAPSMGVGVGAIAIGMSAVSETDSGLAMVPDLGAVFAELAPANSINTAQGMFLGLGALEYAVTSVTEVDTSLPPSVSLGAVAYPIAVVGETDTSLPPSASLGATVYPVAAVGETDASSPLSVAFGAMTYPVAAVAETDASSPLSASLGDLSVPLSSTSEHDTSLPLSVAQGALSLPISLASENDGALPLSVSLGASLVSASLAIGSDDAKPLGVGLGALLTAISSAAEIDQPEVITASAGATVRTIAAPSEADSAPDLIATTGSTSISLGLVDETDVSPAVVVGTGGVVETLATSAEHDQTSPISVDAGSLVVSIDPSVGIGTAHVMSTVVGPVAIPLVVPGEHDSALTATPVLDVASVSLSSANEADVAQSQSIQTGEAVITVDTGFESNSAIDVFTSTGGLAYPMTTATESDAAHISVPVPGLLTVGLALSAESDLAPPVTSDLGASSVELGHPQSHEVALPAGVALGTASIPLARSVSPEHATPLTVTLGEVSGLLGHAYTHEQAFGASTALSSVDIPLGLASEREQAYPVSTSGALTIGVSLAMESDIGHIVEIASALTLPLGSASTVTHALALTVGYGPVTVAMSGILTNESALAVSSDLGTLTRLLGQVIEADETGTITIETGAITVPIGMAGESDSALSVKAFGGLPVVFRGDVTVGVPPRGIVVPVREPLAFDRIPVHGVLVVPVPDRD